MSFFTEKKNLPIIIGVAVVVVGGATAGILYATGVIGGSTAGSTAATTSAPATPVATTPPVTPGVPAGVPGAPPGAMPRRPLTSAQLAHQKQLAKLQTKGVKKQLVAKKPAVSPKVAKAAAAAAANNKVVASNMPDPGTVPDPFQLPKIPEVQPEPTDRIPGVPMIPSPLLSNYRDAPPVQPIDNGGGAPQTEASSSGRRMAGVLFGDGVYAILETNGKTEAVQPGDTVEGGKVVSIAADGLVIKTDDGRLINVPLSSQETGAESSGGYGGPPSFGGPPGFGAPPGFGGPVGTGGGPPDDNRRDNE